LRILTIETATPVEAVAVVDGEDLLAERTTLAGRGRADELVSAVASVLSESGLGLRELEAVAISIGPGRFTGLRVGLATAKGLTAATGLPLLPVPTLEALAASAPAVPGAALVCPMLDARRGEVYAALFRRGPVLKRVLPERAIDPTEFAVLVRDVAAGSGVVFVGTGAALYSSELTGELEDLALFPEPAVERPGPVALATLAAGVAERGGVDDSSLVPVYLRGV
jgi:tRNA threonylcarbamoyladenosine biosynthesis protein TsaB